MLGIVFLIYFLNIFLKYTFILYVYNLTWFSVSNYAVFSYCGGVVGLTSSKGWLRKASLLLLTIRLLNIMTLNKQINIIKISRGYSCKYDSGEFNLLIWDFDINVDFQFINSFIFVKYYNWTYQQIGIPLILRLNFVTLN